jgi:hypothetical protein
MAVSRIQGANGNDASGGNFANFPVSFAAPVASGNAVIAVFTVSNTATCTVTDDKGNTYTNLPYDYISGFSYGIGTAYCLNVTNGPKTITLHPSPANPYPSLIIEEFSGLSAFDATSGNIDTGSPSSYSTGNVTPVGNGELLYTICWAANSGPLTVNSPFVYSQQAGSFQNVADAYYVQPTAASIGATWHPPSAQPGVARIAAFKGVAPPVDLAGNFSV